MGTPAEASPSLLGIHSDPIFGPGLERWEWWAGDCWSDGASASIWESRAVFERAIARRRGSSLRRFGTAKRQPGQFLGRDAGYIFARRERSPGSKSRSHADRTARYAMEGAHRRCACSPQRAGVVLFAGTPYRSIAASAGRRIVGRGHGSGKRPTAADPA